MIVNFPNKHPLNRERFRFKVTSVPLKSRTGRPEQLPVIRLYDEKWGFSLDTPPLEPWYLEPDGNYLRGTTSLKKASSICAFMNYLLWETECDRLSDVSKNTLAGFNLWFCHTLTGEIRNRDEWERGIGYVFDFLGKFYEHNCYTFPFRYSPKDLYTEVEGQNPRSLQKTTQRIYKMYGVKPPVSTKKKYRYLPEGYLELLLETALKHDPMIALPIALQAYAGLREGEVVNVAQGSIHLITKGFGRVASISIDLDHPAPFAMEWKGKTEFGSIKVPRTQLVYYSFLSKTQKLYNDHQARLAKLGVSTKNGAPLFVNKNGKPMTEACYCGRVKKLFYDHFLPALKNLCEEQGLWPENAPFIEAYEREFPGTHAMRHWYTMFLLVHEKLDTKQVAKWRGDQSEQSMEDYVHLNLDMMELFTSVAFAFQRAVFEDYV